jgi:putative endopeptidase
MKSIQFSFALCALLFISAHAVAQSEKSRPKLIDPANMDVTVKPGDDFQKYAGGV